MVEAMTGFPVMWPWGQKKVAALKAAGCPRTVPWAVMHPHEAQALWNHGQTIQRLAERGGLSPQELLAVLTDHHWKDTYRLDDITAAKRLVAVLAGPSASPIGTLRDS